MKKFTYGVFFLAIVGIAMVSCKKEIISDEIKNTNLKTTEEIEDIQEFSREVIVYSENNEISATIMFSSNCEEIIEYHLNNFDISISINDNFNLDDSVSLNGNENLINITNLVNNSDIDPQETLYLEVISFDPDIEVESYSINMNRKIRNEKNAVPTYYTLEHKQKLDDFKYGGVKYNPIYNDFNGILVKFGYTRTWIASWNWESSWTWHKPSRVWYITNPWSNTSNRRIGSRVASNYLNNFAFIYANSPFPTN